MNDMTVRSLGACAEGNIWWICYAKTPTRVETIKSTLTNEISKNISFRDTGENLVIIVPTGLPRKMRRNVHRILLEAETGLSWKFGTKTIGSDGIPSNLIDIYSPFYQKVTFPSQNILTRLSKKSLGKRVEYVESPGVRFNATCAVPVGIKKERQDFLRLFSKRCAFSQLNEI